MTPIILLLILAIGYALCGDTSGIKAIGKFILYGALILGVMAIIVYAPWLIIIIIAVVIIWACVSSKGNSHPNNTGSYDNPIINTSQNEIIHDDSLTGFKAELQENTKTPLQIQEEQNNKEVREAYTQAENDYAAIKRNILNQAKSGNYQATNGKRNIIYDFDYMFTPSFIKSESKMVHINKTMFNQSGQLANEVSFSISNYTYYNSYIRKIKELAKQDDISVDPLVVKKNDSSVVHSLPFRTVGFAESDYHYKFILRCRIQY